MLEDWYFDDTRLRLRRETGVDGRVTSWKLARKYGATGPGVEPITNLYLTEAEHALLSRLPGSVLVKRRHDLWSAGTRFVIDVFAGALSGRMIAEVEADDAARLWSLHPPPWCGAEITGDQAYGGASLARDGWPGTDQR